MRFIRIFINRLLLLLKDKISTWATVINNLNFGNSKNSFLVCINSSTKTMIQNLHMHQHHHLIPQGVGLDDIVHGQ